MIRKKQGLFMKSCLFFVRNIEELVNTSDVLTKMTKKYRIKPR